MARDLAAGMTDYSHQSFQDIIDDLNNWRTGLIDTAETINVIIMQLKECDYWKKVPDDYRSLIMYTLKFYETSTTEINDIIQNIEIEVQENHVSRLRSLAKTADELNGNFGWAWHNHYGAKDYDDPNFRKVERIYATGRDMVVDMLDLDNAAARLHDYVGMKNKNEKKTTLKELILPILILILGIVTAIVSNVASSVLPPSFQPYLWWSWPLLVILTIISIILMIKQGKSDT